VGGADGAGEDFVARGLAEAPSGTS
jgi:hypothetical protein